jgi:hypothetical protein
MDARTVNTWWWEHLTDTWRRATDAQPNRFRKEGAMLSTTAEPECPQRPFVISCTMTEPAGGEVTVDEGTPTRTTINALAHATIHSAADRVKAYDPTARAISPAVH